MSSFTLWFASEWLLHRVWGVHFFKNCYFSVLLESLFQYYLEKMNKLNGVFQFKCHQMSLNGSLLLNHRRCERFSEFTVSQPLPKGDASAEWVRHLSPFPQQLSWHHQLDDLRLTLTLLFFFCIKVGSSFPQTSNPWLGGFPQYAADTLYLNVQIRACRYSVTEWSGGGKGNEMLCVTTQWDKAHGSCTTSPAEGLHGAGDGGERTASASLRRSLG